MRWRFDAFGMTGRSRFGRNIWQLTRANALAQALPILAAPLLTRLYAPADFGALAVFAAWLSVALAIATARFDWSLPNARNASMAAALLVLGMSALLLSCMILVGGLLLVRDLPTAQFDALGGALWLLVPALAGSGLQQLLTAWHVRSAELTGVGHAKVTQSAANVLVSLAAAPTLTAVQGLWGLLAGILAGAWTGLGILSRTATGLRQALGTLTQRRLAVAWRRFGSEAGWSSLVALCNAASFAVVPLVLMRHYSATEVGLYALVQRVALGPVGLVGQAVSQSFWSEAARLVRTDRLALINLYSTSTRRLLWLAPLPAMLAAAGPLYMGPLFGREQWADAGAVIAACVPMIIGQVAISPLSHLVIHRRQHWQAMWDVVRLLSLVFVIEASGQAGLPLPWTVMAISCVMAVMYVVLWRLNLRALAAT